MHEGQIGVSVVIPLYNKEQRIEATIQSVLEQGYSHFECIVVDDGSTDGGAAVVERIEDPRVVLIRQENTGQAAARNQGIEAAHYPLVAFLDADDEWKPNHLSVLTRLYRAFPEAGAYATAYKIRGTDGRLRVPLYGGMPPAPWEGLIPDYFRTSTLGIEPLLTSCVGVRRDVLLKTGGFKTKYRQGEDTDLWLRIALEYSIAFSTQATVVYHVDHDPENSVSQRKQTRDTFESPHMVAWVELDDGSNPWFGEYVAKKQLQVLSGLYSSGFRKEVQERLRYVQTSTHRAAKLWLSIKTLFPVGWWLKGRRLKWWSIRYIRYGLGGLRRLIGQR